MDWDLIYKALQLVSILAGGFCAVLMFFSRNFIPSKKHVDDAHHRLDLVEQRMSQLPTDADIGALRTDISAMRTDMRENSVRVETAVLGVKRIEDFLMGAKS